MRFAHIAAGFLVACFARAAMADIAPEPQYGQSIAPGKNPVDVEMVEETVRIILEEKSASVTAVFYLANRGQSTAFEVGFPDVVVPRSFGGGPPDGVSEYKLRNFTAMVDGEIVKHDYKWVQRKDSPRMIEEIGKLERQIKDEKNPAARGMLEKRLARLKENLEDWSYLGWIVWKMQFPAGKTRKVEVSYEVGYIPSYGPSLLGEGRFEYILKTGAGWKGRIGKADIDVILGDGVLRGQVDSIAPQGSKETERGFSWVLSDFEPSEDIRFGVKRYADFKAAAKAYHVYAEKEGGKENPDTFMLASAAMCEEQGELWEDCVETCRQIIAIEKSGKSPYVIRWFKDSYEPWQARMARCLGKLGRREEALAAAGDAIAIMERLLARSNREPPYVNEKRIRELIDECRRIGK